MNKRIQELMGQTLDEKFAGTWSVMDLQDLTKFADRFAELIVQECADIGERYADGNYEVRNQIMAQFGLEEPEE